jgi:hypothetical protein
MLNWRQLENLLRRGLGRSHAITAGAKSYPAI